MQLSFVLEPRYEQILSLPEQTFHVYHTHTELSMHAPSGAAGGSGNGQAAVISEETKQMCIDDRETKSVVMENTHAHMHAYTHTNARVILVGTWPLLPPLDVAHCSGAKHLITRHTSCDSKADFCLFAARALICIVAGASCHGRLSARHKPDYTLTKTVFFTRMSAERCFHSKSKH